MRRVAIALACSSVGCFSDQPTSGAGTDGSSTEAPTEASASASESGPPSTGTTVDGTGTTTEVDPESSSTGSCALLCAPGDIGRVHWWPSSLSIDGIDHYDGDDLALLIGFSGDQEIGGQTFENPGGTDVVVARLDQDGQLEVGDRWDGESDVFALGFAAVPSGRLAFVAVYAATITAPDGVVLPEAQDGTYNLAVGVHDGDLSMLQHHAARTSAAFVAGIDIDTSNRVLVGFAHSGQVQIEGGPTREALGMDGALWRIDSVGANHDLTGFGGSGDEMIAGLVYHGAELGPARIVGEFSGDIATAEGMISPLAAGTADAFVAAVDAAGAVTWARRIASDGPDLARGVAVDAMGAVYVFGHFDGTFMPERGEPVQSAGAQDLVLSKYSADGTLQWQRVWGSIGEDQARAVAVADGVVVAAGEARNAIDVDGHAYAPNGGADALVISVDAEDGSVRWLHGFGAGNDDRATGVAFTTEGVWALLRLYGEATVGDETIGEAGPYGALVLLVP